MSRCLPNAKAISLWRNICLTPITFLMNNVVIRKWKSNPRFHSVAFHDTVCRPFFPFVRMEAFKNGLIKNRKMHGWSFTQRCTAIDVHYNKKALLLLQTWPFMSELYAPLYRNVYEAHIFYTISERIGLCFIRRCHQAFQTYQKTPRLMMRK